MRRLPTGFAYALIPNSCTGPTAPTSHNFCRATKSFDDLGIRGFGFAPLKLPPELDFAGMFHGVDERVPVSALEFGTRVLDRLLRTC